VTRAGAAAAEELTDLLPKELQDVAKEGIENLVEPAENAGEKAAAEAATEAVASTPAKEATARAAAAAAGDGLASEGQKALVQKLVGEVHDGPAVLDRLLAGRSLDSLSRSAIGDVIEALKNAPTAKQVELIIEQSKWQKPLLASLLRADGAATVDQLSRKQATDVIQKLLEASAKNQAAGAGSLGAAGAKYLEGRAKDAGGDGESDKPSGDSSASAGTGTNGKKHDITVTIHGASPTDVTVEDGDTTVHVKQDASSGFVQSLAPLESQPATPPATPAEPK
jgi:hypothetical protein